MRNAPHAIAYLRRSNPVQWHLRRVGQQVPAQQPVVQLDSPRPQLDPLGQPRGRVVAEPHESGAQVHPDAVDPVGLDLSEESHGQRAVAYVVGAVASDPFSVR